MSTAPTRMRSLRKPALEGKQSDKTTSITSAEALTRNQSPSRLPKPQSSTTATAGVSRTTTTSRPGTSNSNASTRPPSQRIGISRPPPTSDNKASSLRSGTRTPTEPNSSLQHTSSTRHSRNASASAVPTTSRPPITSQTQTRTRTSSTSRAPQLVPPTGSTLIRPPSASAHSSQHELKTSTVPRPAFSTLQQHFSPARSLAPKTPTAAFLAPPSPSKLPSNVQISAETARLQAELLQLHLLHRSAASVSAQYRASARAKLGRRFEDVKDTHEELVALEAEEQKRRNARALKAWAENGAVGWGLDERVRVLDMVLSGVWKLGESGGKYVRAVKRFERWVAGVSDLLGEREHGRAGLEQGGEVKFVQDLDTEWKDECQILARKLEGWRDQLRDVGDVGMNEAMRDSTLRVVVQGIGELVRGMLAEVQAMERVQKAVMTREEEWIREMIDDAFEEDDSHSVPGAAWRTY